MTFIRDDQIQAAFLTNIQSKSAITDEVAAAQIKELQPQRTEFSYPGIRIRVGPNNPGEDGCGQDVTIRILCFSEEASSQQVMRIAGIIMQEYHDRSFTLSGLGQAVQCTGVKANLIPAIRQTRTTWRSEVVLSQLVSSG